MIESWPPARVGALRSARGLLWVRYVLARGLKSSAGYGVGIALTVAAQLAFAAGAVPTFNQEVAPILYGRCATCHRPGQIGAEHSMLGYQSARAQALAIADQVATRQMPPWPADPAHSLKFRNDARLSDTDIEVLVRWARGGAPRGDGEPPPLPADNPAWKFPGGRPPDAILKLADVAIPAHGEVPYVQQRVKVTLPADQWIVAMQLRPGNAAIVHHVGITEIALADGVSAADLEQLTQVAKQMGLPAGALSNTQPAVRDPANHAYDMLGVYTPGTTFEQYEDGTAKLLKAGQDRYVNFNTHFNTNGVAQNNHLELGLWFQAGPPPHQLFRAPAAVGTLIANGTQLLTDTAGTRAEGTDVAIPPIPAYADNFELVGMTAYILPLTLYQLQPHAHMRGKSFRYSVIYPDGHELTVLTVPRYDFHWQLAYDLDQPLQMPAGSKLVVTAHYDNSANNRHMREPGVDPSNCGPDKAAYFRRENQGWNEMFSPLVQYSDESPAAPSAPAVRLVETQGCLTRGDGQSFGLERASPVIEARVPSTSLQSLRESAARPLGGGRFRLLGVAAFRPQGLIGTRVQVKGALIADTADPRLNVTSLQKLPGSCR